MWKISVYIISLLIICSPDLLLAQEQPDDSVTIPLKIKAGFDVTGPVIYLTDRNILNTEGFVSVDLNEKYALYAGGGYSDFKYSQYNYSYFNKGIYFKVGIDINLLRPELTEGRYWAGVGLRYGLSAYTSEIPEFRYTNYWGPTTSSVGPSTRLGHYFEISPGVRIDLFKNFTIGWSVNLRRLIYSGTGRDLRPVYFPGFGRGGNPFSAGVSYFMTFNFPYKKIRVEIRKDIPEETEDTTGTEEQISISR